jgi:hypothetical protein
MKTKIILLSILVLPTIIYVYFALGVPKASRAPFYGPRKTITVLDKKTGEDKIDTVYYSVPAFNCKTVNGSSFSSDKLNGRLYIAVFVNPDSVANLFPFLEQDLRLNRGKHIYSRFVFFYPGDSLGNPSLSAPDFTKEFNLGIDTGFTCYLSLQSAYFIHDPARAKDPWTSESEAVIIDRKGRIRGYYNIRSAAKIKELREDAKFIFQRDEGVETVEDSKIEKK